MSGGHAVRRRALERRRINRIHSRRTADVMTLNGERPFWEKDPHSLCDDEDDREGRLPENARGWIKSRS